MDEGARPFGELLQLKLHRRQGGAGGLLARTINPKGMAAENIFEVAATALSSLVRSPPLGCATSNVVDAKQNVGVGVCQLVLAPPGGEISSMQCTPRHWS